jgi:dipeptidyl aminopeptidase/acylaminoacyl peptidase
MRKTTGVFVLFAAACGNGGATASQNSETPDAATDCGTTSHAPIVFAAMLDGQAATDLYMMDAHGQPQRLTTTPGAELYPAWSPDRTQVAFVRDQQLYVLDVDTGAERRVAEHVGRDTTISGAAWSPDGSRLVYPYPRDRWLVDSGADGFIDESYDTTLHFVNADGTNDVAYNEPPGPSFNPSLGVGTFSGPAWSSTNVLAFIVDDDCPDCAGGLAYGLDNPDGGAYRNIEPDDLALYPLYPRQDLDWSPDATRWVFASLASTPTGWSTRIATRLVDDTDSYVALTGNGASYPRYAPDADSIAFVREDGIYVMSTDGSDQHQILSASNVAGLDW